MTTSRTTEYEWVIVGGGIAGIVLSEILTREGHSVLLVEREERLAGEATKILHEWIHTGSLYTLIPDRLVTVKFLLGALDDMLEYYTSFKRMNLTPTERGLGIEGSNGWFLPNYIQFRYKRRKLNLPWSLTVARSAYLINQIKKHDWLRRRAGILDEFSERKVRSIGDHLKAIMSGTGEFYDVDCPDFTSNSRHILRDLVATACTNGLELSLGNPVLKVEDQGGGKAVVTEKGTFNAANVVICAGKSIPDFLDVRVKTTIAPMAVVRGLEPGARSFVELDYIVKNCINLVTKSPGVGLIGGISVNTESQAKEYIDYVIARHRKVNPTMEVIGIYNGYKNEILFRNQDRNYLFHIVPTSSHVWAVVPGKFTLGFSLAAEFYRRIYNKNPRKVFLTVIDDGTYGRYVSETRWHELAHTSKE